MSRTVLIVNDLYPFRAVARALLLLEDFAVVGEAADARSALEAVGRLRPDVVIPDIQLADLRLRGRPPGGAGGGPPVIVLVSS